WRVTTGVMDENKQAMIAADEFDVDTMMVMFQELRAKQIRAAAEGRDGLSPEMRAFIEDAKAQGITRCPIRDIETQMGKCPVDLNEIARYASGNGATVVVGTNGTLLSDDRIATLKQAGVQGLAVSVDSLRPSYHDNFRHGRGALADVQAALARLSAARLDFIVQTTVTRGNRAELERLVDWSAEQGAVSFNCYFLVSTGRGASLTDLAPADYEAVLADLARWERAYRGRMLVRAKCAPHFMRHVHHSDPESPVLNYQTRCPCGTQYCRITPDGQLTPCPYLPEVAGDLRTQSF